MKTYADCFAYATQNAPVKVSADTHHYPERNLFYNLNTQVYTRYFKDKVVSYHPNETTETEPFNGNGCVLYDGPSAWDGERIVVVLTGLTDASANDKTDDMLQTWILRADQKPIAARQTGADATVCGDCPHRSGSCYVNLGQGPRAVWVCWNAGRYLPYAPAIHDKYIRGRMLRIGSYGDPAMVPVRTFSQLLPLVDGHTGYTHQWDKPIGEAYRPICMASCDTEAQTFRAVADGWRFFYVSPSVSGPDGATLCPASEEAGKKTNCNRCGLCAGASRSARSVFIPLHGNLAQKSIYHNRTALALV